MFLICNLKAELFAEARNENIMLEMNFAQLGNFGTTLLIA